MLHDPTPHAGASHAHPNGKSRHQFHSFQVDIRRDLVTQLEEMKRQLNAELQSFIHDVDVTIARFLAGPTSSPTRSMFGMSPVRYRSIFEHSQCHI
jgi:hypothetical protein